MKKIVFILGLLAAVGVAVWFVFFHSRSKPSAEIDALVMQLREKPPWRFRLLKISFYRKRIPLAWQKKAEHANWTVLSRRLQAGETLVKLGTNVWPAVPALLDLVKNDDAEIALPAAKVLAGIKATEHPNWRQWQQTLSGDTIAARNLHWMLVAFDFNSRKYDADHRRFALIGLGATGVAGRRAYADVFELIKTPAEPKLQLAAVQALVGMEQQSDAVPVFREILRNPTEWPASSAMAAEALAIAAPADPATRELLRQALEDERSQVRLAAARALWQVHAPPAEVLPTLTLLLKHRLVSNRLGALKVLGDMGALARSQRAAIEALLADDNEQVQTAARETLRQLDLYTSP